jgi:hypothetical protein
LLLCLCQVWLWRLASAVCLGLCRTRGLAATVVCSGRGQGVGCNACDELLPKYVVDYLSPTLCLSFSPSLFVLVQDVLLRQGLVCYTVADDRARREASRLYQEAASLQETLSKLREDNLVREHLLAMNSLLERSIAQFNAVSDTIRRQIAEARQTEQLQEQKQPQAAQAAQAAQAPTLAAAADSASSGAGRAQPPALIWRVLQTLPLASAAAGPGVAALAAGAQRKRKRSASAEPACKRRRPSPD